jgi:hypothetical protein
MQKIFFLFVLFFSTLSVMSQNSDMDFVIKLLKEKYAPDSRVGVFNVEAVEQGASLSLKVKRTVGWLMMI